MNLRLFLAVALDDASRALCAAAAEVLRRSGFAARYVPPENYHLTVAFLGSVDLARLPVLEHGTRDALHEMRAFTLPLERVGAFPSERRARVAWVGLSGDSVGFASLCLRVREPLRALGFVLDDRDDPHVTLARAEGHAPLPAVALDAPGVVSVDALVLYRSTTAPDGARYEALARWEFGGRGE